jgi:hypothetical protein
VSDVDQGHGAAVVVRPMPRHGRVYDGWPFVEDSTARCSIPLGCSPVAGGLLAADVAAWSYP